MNKNEQNRSLNKRFSIQLLAASSALHSLHCRVASEEKLLKGGVASPEMLPRA